MRAFMLVVALSTAIAAATLRFANADEPWSFVQITCAPELGYFSIRRLVVMNVPKKGPYLTEGLAPGPAAVAAIERQYGIFDSEGLKGHPFKCSIGAFKPVPGWDTVERAGYDIEVIGHHDDNSQSPSYCMIADDAEVRLNGRSIGVMRLNPCGNNPGSDIIEIAHNGVNLTVRACAGSDHPSADGSDLLTCSEEPVRADAR